MTGRGAAPLLLAALLLAGTAGARPGSAETVEGLYRGEAIVTGQDNLAERERGFREALTDVLVKVSGDAHLPQDPRLAPLLARPDALVESFAYEDRLAKKTVMDEQGTRERSYVLRVAFRADAIDRALAEAGARPWAADRSRLLLLLAIRDTVGPYLLETGSERGYGQREAARSVARRRGIPLVLPTTGTGAGDPAAAFQAVAQGDAATVERLRRWAGADAVLLGTMTVTPDGLWETQWSLQPQGGERRWSVSPTSFDRAIAEAIDRSARALAGLE